MIHETYSTCLGPPLLPLVIILNCYEMGAAHTMGLLTRLTFCSLCLFQVSENRSKKQYFYTLLLWHWANLYKRTGQNLKCSQLLVIPKWSKHHLVFQSFFRAQNQHYISYFYLHTQIWSVLAIQGIPAFRYFTIRDPRYFVNLFQATISWIPLHFMVLKKNSKKKKIFFLWKWKIRLSQIFRKLLLSRNIESSVH